MIYKLWQVREKTSSKIYIYAVRDDIDVTDVIDCSKYILYNQKGEWEISGFGDFPKYFRWDYRSEKDNKHY